MTNLVLDASAGVELLFDTTPQRPPPGSPRRSPPSRPHLPRVQIRPLLAGAWAKRANLTIGDALHLALAEHLGATLVTSDRNLTRGPTLTVPTIHP